MKLLKQFLNILFYEGLLVAVTVLLLLDALQMLVLLTFFLPVELKLYVACRFSYIQVPFCVLDD